MKTKKIIINTYLPSKVLQTRKKSHTIIMVYNAIVIRSTGVYNFVIHIKLIRDVRSTSLRHLLLTCLCVDHNHPMRINPNQTTTYVYLAVN